VGKLIVEKQITYKEDMTYGLENMVDAFAGMLSGKNFGKAVTKIAE